MNSDQLNVIVGLIFSLLGGVMGYWLKYYLDKKKELIDQVNVHRRVLYQDFINLMIDLFTGNKINKPMKDGDLTKKLYDIYKKQILYASPNVVNSFGDMFQELYKANQEGREIDIRIMMRKLSKVMFMMREDIGLDNKGLGKDGENLFRGMFTDFDKSIK